MIPHIATHLRVDACDDGHVVVVLIDSDGAEHEAHMSEAVAISTAGAILRGADKLRASDNQQGRA